MAKDGGNNGDDPVDDLFDAIQTVHDRRVREETQTALLRQPQQKPKIRIGWIAAIGVSAVALLSIAGWMVSRFQASNNDAEKAAEALDARDARARAQPSAASEPWAERASPLPAFQAPPTPNPENRHSASPSPVSPVAPTSLPSARPSESDMRNYQEETHPAEVRPKLPQQPEPEYDDGEEDTPMHRDTRKTLPPGEGEPEGFFE